MPTPDGLNPSVSDSTLCDENSLPLQGSAKRIDWRSGLFYLVSLAALIAGMQAFLLALDLQLENHEYSQPFLLLEAVRHWPQLLVVVLATGILAAAGQRTSWKSFDQPQLIRFFIVALCAAIAWAYSAYAMNYFHGHLHLMSRLALIGLAVAIYFHPAALPAFIAVACLLAHQFEGDLPGSYTWNDKRILFHILSLFTMYQFWKLATRQGLALFLTACLSLVSAYYFQAGFNKATLPGWAAGNELVNFIFASHVGGWFLATDGDAAVRVLNTMRPANFLMMAGTLTIELGAVLLLCHRKVACVWLCGFVLLHSMIFTLMGILFWKWICMDLCLLVVVWRLKEPLARQLFSPGNFASGIATILGILAFVEPWGQSSLNTPLTATFRFEAVGESGQRYSLSSDFFAPYDVIFAQRRFYCLSGQEPIVSTFGSTKDREVFESIQQAGPDRERIAAIIGACQEDDKIRTRGQHDNPKLAKRFDEFVIRFVRAKMAAGPSNIAHRIGPFRHILQSPGGEGLAPFDWQEPISKVDVYEVQKYLDVQAIHTLKDEVCHRVEVGPEQLAEKEQRIRR